MRHVQRAVSRDMRRAANDVKITEHNVRVNNPPHAYLPLVACLAVEPSSLLHSLLTSLAVMCALLLRVPLRKVSVSLNSRGRECSGPGGTGVIHTADERGRK